MNRLKDAFDQIQADEELKNRTKEILARKIQGNQKRHFPTYRHLAAAFACLLLLLSGWGGYSVYFTQVYAISVDVNPSIELGINQFDKVIAVNTYNEDGYTLMSAIDVRFLDYRDALDKILANEHMAQYLAQSQLIAITVCGGNIQENDEMLANLAACTTSYENVHCSSGSSEDAAGAHSTGMSCGKYKAFLELQALKPDITPEDVRDLTIQQIRDIISTLSGGTGNPAPGNDTETCEPGNGQGHGSGHGNHGHHN